MGQNTKVGVLGGHISQSDFDEIFLSGSPICLLTPYIKMILGFSRINHFSTTGRCSGPAHYDVSIRQAARAAFVTSSLKKI